MSDEILENEEMDNIIELDDEEGNTSRFEFLDIVVYESNEYVVLLPVDEEDDQDAGELVILQLEEDENEDLENYISVEDEDVLQAVFDIFKDKYKDEFNFVD